MGVNRTKQAKRRVAILKSQGLLKGRATDTRSLDQEQINSLIDKGISVGRKEGYKFAKINKESPKSSNIPAARHVADAVKGGHITRLEAVELNRHYLQHMSKDDLKATPKTKSPRKPRPKKEKVSVAPSYTTRMVNGREFKVYTVPEDTSMQEKVRKEEKAATRTIYRPKTTKY